MIDIHSHLIPDFDDGPKSFEESLELLRGAEKQGITEVFATSHFNEIIPKHVEQEYFEKLSQLRNLTEDNKINIKIHSGAEIFYHHWVDNTVKSSKVATLGNRGQYVLIEFPMYQMPSGAEEVLFRLKADNYIPVVAHAERYVAIIKNRRRITNFIKYGGLLQLNAGSILGYFGKDIQKTAFYLLNNRLVHFVASDAHCPKTRPFLLQKASEFLKNRIPFDYIEQLVYGNPKKIIDQELMDKAQISAKSEKVSILEMFKNRLKITF